MKKKREARGITLVALVITIIILLILAGVTIKSITSQNGLIKNAKIAKELTEISSESEFVELAVVNSQMSEPGLDKDELQKKLELQGEGIATVEEDVDTLIVSFKKSEREYEVDEKGKVNGPIKKIIDQYPGDITKGINGEELDGNEKPYEINCIEDLVEFSNEVRNNKYSTERVVLKRSLSFTSTRSYTNYKTTKYGDINENNKVEELMTELTNGCGFEPIGKYEYNETTNEIEKNIFAGEFDGMRE